MFSAKQLKWYIFSHFFQMNVALINSIKAIFSFNEKQTLAYISAFLSVFRTSTHGLLMLNMIFLSLLHSFSWIITLQSATPSQTPQTLSSTWSRRCFWAKSLVGNSTQVSHTHYSFNNSALSTFVNHPAPSLSLLWGWLSNFPDKHITCQIEGSLIANVRNKNMIFRTI